MNIRQNIRYANMLYNNFSGEAGELTAVTQYLYEHMELKRYENFSKIMLSISIEEMKHFVRFLSTLIALFAKKYRSKASVNDLVIMKRIFADVLRRLLVLQ